MSAHVLLNSLNDLDKEIKCEACRAFYLFFATSLINSRMLVSIYHMTNTLKSHLWRKNVIILSLHVMYAALLWTS